MGRQALLHITILLLLNIKFSTAQKVLYSPFIDDQFEVVGKSNNYYWVEKKQTKKIGRQHILSEIENFEIYDSRMGLINETAPFVLSDKILKEYFISNDNYFDELVFMQGEKNTLAILNRFTPDGDTIVDGRTILSLPFHEDGNSFIMARSEDKSKILLLCFGGGSSYALYAILFDKSWRQLSYIVYKHNFITQPLIQDDFNSYPIEYFNSSPLKLSNSGQWLMAVPSRTNNNFLLFHFNGRDTAVVYKEIKLPEYSTWEDVALSIDNEKEEALAGVLSIFRYPSLKNVEVVHYSLQHHELDFDSSYRFNTLMAYRILNENLTHESFIMVPGKGFMLLKEYGRPYDDVYDNNKFINPGGLASVFTDNAINNIVSPLLINRDGYTRYNMLGGSRGLYNRGDLCMFYFPADHADSCWSGIIDKEQITEFNSPYLSYFVVPVNERIFLLYNNLFRNDEQFGNATILDYKGNLLTDEGLVYWRTNNTLTFQQAHLISENEVAVPYENFKRKGFAIIRF